MALTTLVLGTVVCAKLKRSKAWFALMLACFTYSLSLLLLLGRQMGPNPPFGLCFLQAAIIYAGPAFVAFAFASMVVEFYLQLRAELDKKKLSCYLAHVLILSPWAFFIFLLIVVMLVITDPSGVKRDMFFPAYCHVASTEAPSYITSAIVMVCSLVGLFYEVKAGLLLRKNWAAFKEISNNNPMISWSLYLRICGLTLAAAIAAGISVFVISRDKESEILSFWKTFLPIVPAFVALAFGTQKEIMETWMFWKRIKRRKPSGFTGLASTASNADPESFPG